MAMLYGEGARAFIRLQEEIMRGSDEQSLFAWRAECDGDYHGLLADSPEAFRDSALVAPVLFKRRPQFTHTITNRGTQIEMPFRMWDYQGAICAFLECGIPQNAGYVGIVLSPTGESERHYARRQCTYLPLLKESPAKWSTFNVRQALQRSVAAPERDFLAIKLATATLPLPPPDRRPHIHKAVYLDLFTSGQEWTPSYSKAVGQGGSYQEQEVRVPIYPSMLAAYLICSLPFAEERFVVLIGFDQNQNIAFDVWESPNKELDRWLFEDCAEPSYRQVLPDWLKVGFDQQPPRIPLEKLRDRMVLVTPVETTSSRSKPICAFHIRCWEKPHAVKARGGGSSSGRKLKNLTK